MPKVASQPHHGFGVLKFRVLVVGFFARSLARGFSQLAPNYRVWIFGLLRLRCLWLALRGGFGGIGGGRRGRPVLLRCGNANCEANQQECKKPAASRSFRHG